MSYLFFYGYTIFIWLAFLFCIRFRHLNLNHFIIGISTIAYSLTYETILGNWLGLYHYLDKGNSTFYIVFAGIFIYPVLNILYVLFLPGDRKHLLLYTGVWIIAMLIFEYVTVLQRIVVMTGWKPIPWSFTTYVFTYLWIIMLFLFLEKKAYYRN